MPKMYIKAYKSNKETAETHTSVVQITVVYKLSNHSTVISGHVQYCRTKCVRIVRVTNAKNNIDEMQQFTFVTQYRVSHTYTK